MFSQLGVLVSAALAAATVCNQNGVLQGMTASPEVRPVSRPLSQAPPLARYFTTLSLSMSFLELRPGPIPAPI